MAMAFGLVGKMAPEKLAGWKGGMVHAPNACCDFPDMELVALGAPQTSDQQRRRSLICFQGLERCQQRNLAIRVELRLYPKGNESRASVGDSVRAIFSHQLGPTLVSECYAQVCVCVCLLLRGVVASLPALADSTV